MTSTSLNTLRDLGNAQASVYNDYLPKAAKVRMDDFLSGQARLKQIGALVATAQTSLQNLQESMTTAVAAVQKAATGAGIEPDPFYDQAIRYHMEHGGDLVTLCEQLVADASLAGFASLRRLLPWLARAGQLPGCKMGARGSELERALKTALEIVGPFEYRILPKAAQAAFDEWQEVSARQPMMRTNFETLRTFFDGQLLPSAVAGTFTRPGKLFNWVPLVNGRTDTTTPAYVLLTTDLPALSPSFGGR